MQDQSANISSKEEGRGEKEGRTQNFIEGAWDLHLPAWHTKIVLIHTHTHIYCTDTYKASMCIDRVCLQPNSGAETTNTPKNNVPAANHIGEALNHEG